MKKYLINKNNDLSFALNQMNKNQLKILVCVDDNTRLVGTLSDGDIRRYLVKKNSLNVKIDKIANKKAIYVFNEDNISDKYDLKYNIIPVLDKNKKVISIVELENFKPQNNQLKVNVIGLGYVGITMSCVIAEAGFQVYGLESNKKIRSKLSQKKPTFYEPGLENYLKKYINNNLFISNKLKKANIHIITVGTPINKNKKPILDSIIDASNIISKVLSKGDLIIVRSTVPVGTTINIIIKNLQKNNKLICGSDFSIVFAPERTAEGVALKELSKNPQIIGSYDKKSFNLASNFFNEFCDVVIDAGSLEAAEVCKLIDNTYRDYNFAFANNISLLANSLKLDANKILNLVNLGYDRNNIPLPSPGVGGPCLSKDPYIFANIYSKYNLDNKFIFNARKINEYGPTHLFKKIKNYHNENKLKFNKSKVVIIGLAFKGSPATSDVRNSSSLDMIKLFDKKNLSVYDPVLDKNEIRQLGYNYLTKLEDCFKNKNIIIIMNNHESYKKWDLKTLLKNTHKNFIFCDPWKNFDREYIKSFSNIKYISLDKD